MRNMAADQREQLPVIWHSSFMIIYSEPAVVILKLMYTLMLFYVLTSTYKTGDMSGEFHFHKRKIKSVFIFGPFLIWH